MFPLPEQGEEEPRCRMALTSPRSCWYDCSRSAIDRETLSIFTEAKMGVIEQLDYRYGPIRHSNSVPHHHVASLRFHQVRLAILDEECGPGRGQWRAGVAGRRRWIARTPHFSRPRVLAVSFQLPRLVVEVVYLFTIPYPLLPPYLPHKSPQALHAVVTWTGGARWHSWVCRQGRVAGQKGRRTASGECGEGARVGSSTTNRLQVSHIQACQCTHQPHPCRRCMVHGSSLNATRLDQHALIRATTA